METESFSDWFCPWLPDADADDDSHSLDTRSVDAVGLPTVFVLFFLSSRKIRKSLNFGRGRKERMRTHSCPLSVVGGGWKGDDMMVMCVWHVWHSVGR